MSDSHGSFSQEAKIPTAQTEKPVLVPLKDTLAELQALFAPVFQAQRDEWGREGPAVMARAAALGVEIESKGGNCPVQAEGRFDSHRFYFRARHDAWSLNVWTGEKRYLETENPDEWFTEADYDGGDAGWMPLHEAVALVCDGVEKYRSEKATTASAGGDFPKENETPNTLDTKQGVEP